MLARAARLSASRDFARIYRKGRSARSGFFRISWMDTRALQARVAVVVSRKLSTKAVKRNRIKRQVRAIVTELQPQVLPVDLVIQIQPQPLERFTFAAMRTELRDLLGKQRLLRP
ncbi:ribonuclease P protein component [Candidatus Berkelbacteria bacterium]|nr:ribonuclease P protein component [Candidatus Berkelbacteria bacterium]